jgi:GNAT superfamily N-acetyltransferase
MSVEIRSAATGPEIESYLEIRETVDPENPFTREAFDAEQDTAGRVDLLALVNGTPVGCAFGERQYGDPASATLYVSVRVLESYRRRGHGTALLRSLSEHGRSLGATGHYAAARGEALSLRGFYERHGFREVGRMQDVELELARADTVVDVPDGVEIVPIDDSLNEGMHAVALEADADIPSAAPINTGTVERWVERHIGPLTLRELSFAALADGEVVGFAILGKGVPGVGEHWMTGVKRAWRGRGIGLALKQSQIAAARVAGLERLRTQNDLVNAPMRRVNEKLGYRPRLEWIHFAGPLLPAETR